MMMQSITSLSCVFRGQNDFFSTKQTQIVREQKIISNVKNEIVFFKKFFWIDVKVKKIFV
jgi:hypothetical protein